MSRVIIVGAGAAGLFCAIWAARNGHQVCILEKNEKAGKKLYITGKGRCNLTNACDMNTLLENVVTNRKFLYRAFHRFSNYDTIAFFEELGLKTKTERGGRVFPESDKASDVIGALLRELKQLKVDIRYHTIVKNIYVNEGRLQGVDAEWEGSTKRLPADAAVIATGGLSYPATGSTGDGYAFAERLGHRVTERSPALTPLNIREKYGKELMGLSLKNIRIRLCVGEKEIYGAFGELLFTHFGVSGPVILSASSFLIPWLDQKEPVTLELDLKPALTEEQLDARLLRDFGEMQKKQFSNSLDALLPRKLIPVVVEVSGIDPYKRVNEITREERKRLLSSIKRFRLHVEGLRGYQEAVVTRGGVEVKQVDPATMESRLVENVYFIGEALDLDALTGGFNLQIAWSTAFAAGNGIR